jgi:hypothetical protein
MAFHEGFCSILVFVYEPFLNKLINSITFDAIK